MLGLRWMHGDSLARRRGGAFASAVCGRNALRLECRWNSVDATERVVSSRKKGLAFEARVERIMRALGCQLTATQVSMDGGVDHVGHWKLPDLEIDVATQCKNEKKPVGVQALREFHGVMSLYPTDALGLFFSASGYSIYAHRYFVRTPRAAILCTIDEQDRLAAFHLNDRARAILPKLSVGTSFVQHERELILTYGEFVLGEP